MVRRMSRAGLVGLLLIVGVVAWVLAGSLSASGHSCEVCIEFGGRSQCRTVAAATVDLAREGAVQNACAFLSGGMTESMRCTRTPPISEKCQ